MISEINSKSTHYQIEEPSVEQCNKDFFKEHKNDFPSRAKLAIFGIFPLKNVIENNINVYINIQIKHENPFFQIVPFESEINLSKILFWVK